MAAKLTIIAFLIAIVWLLFSAFYFLIREKGQGDRTVWRLTWRVCLSLLLLALLYGGFLLGWLEPGRGPIGLKP